MHRRIVTNLNKSARARYALFIESFPELLQCVPRYALASCLGITTSGPVETPVFDRLGMPVENVNGIKQYLASGVPLKRLGTTDEMAKGFLYLASDDSSFMLVGELVLDGGIGQL